MIDAQNETIGRLSKACREWVPGGPVSPSTVWRWIYRGIGGVRLEHIQIGGVVMTSREALCRFFEKLTNGSAVPVTRKSVERAHAQAKRELAEIGI